MHDLTSTGIRRFPGESLRRAWVNGLPEEWRVAVVVGFCGAMALGLLSALVRKEPTPRGDDLIYENIAQHPFGIHTFPFGFRFGLPLLVHVLPLAHTAGFSLLALVCMGGAAAFAYLLMRELGTRWQLATALALLMSVSPPMLVVMLRQGRNTRISLQFFFMMAATYFVIRRQYLPLAVTLLLGVTVREAVLFIIPLAYALWADGPVDWSAAARTVTVGAPAVAAYVAIRLGIHTIGEAQVPGYGGSIIGGRFTVIKLGLRSPFVEARRLFAVYGPLWLLAPLALPKMSFARRGLVLVALSLLAMTFALDWGRMILLASPVFYPSAAYVLERRRTWCVPVLASLLLLAIGYAGYMEFSGVRTGIIENPAPPYPVR